MRRIAVVLMMMIVGSAVFAEEAVKKWRVDDDHIIAIVRLDDDTYCVGGYNSKYDHAAYIYLPDKAKVVLCYVHLKDPDFFYGFFDYLKGAGEEIVHISYDVEGDFTPVTIYEVTEQGFQSVFR